MYKHESKFQYWDFVDFVWTTHCTTKKQLCTTFWCNKYNQRKLWRKQAHRAMH